MNRVLKWLSLTNRRHELKLECIDLELDYSRSIRTGEGYKIIASKIRLSDARADYAATCWAGIKDEGM